MISFVYIIYMYMYVFHTVQFHLQASAAYPDTYIGFF